MEDLVIEPEIDQEICSDSGAPDQVAIPDGELVEPDIVLGMDHSNSSNGAGQSISSLEIVQDTEHPSGRPKRKIVKHGRPLDNQFLYYE